MLGINSGKISSYLNPFGGLKESGLEEGSLQCLEPFLETKFVSGVMMIKKKFDFVIGGGSGGVHATELPLHVDLKLVWQRDGIGRNLC